MKSLLRFVIVLAALGLVGACAPTVKEYTLKNGDVARFYKDANPFSQDQVAIEVVPKPEPPKYIPPKLRLEYGSWTEKETLKSRCPDFDSPRNQVYDASREREQRGGFKDVPNPAAAAPQTKEPRQWGYGHGAGAGKHGINAAGQASRGALTGVSFPKPVGDKTYVNTQATAPTTLNPQFKVNSTSTADSWSKSGADANVDFNAEIGDGGKKGGGCNW